MRSSFRTTGLRVCRKLSPPPATSGRSRQPRDQRLRAPAAERGIHGQALPTWGSSAEAREVRLHGGFVEKHHPLGPGGDGGETVPHPVGALLSYPGAAAFGCDQRLFLYVKPSRVSSFAMDEW